MTAYKLALKLTQGNNYMSEYLVTLRVIDEPEPVVTFIVLADSKEDAMKKANWALKISVKKQ